MTESALIGQRYIPNGICQYKNEEEGRVSTDSNQQPARLLEQGNFNYIGSDSLNAQQLKPPPVIDAEFRLADDMFSISNLVGGPSGGHVSQALPIKHIHASIITGVGALT